MSAGTHEVNSLSSDERLNKVLGGLVKPFIQGDWSNTYFIDGEEFDSAVIGIGLDGRLIYSREKVLEVLDKDFGDLEADDRGQAVEEYFAFNIASLPYFIFTE